LRVPAPLLLPAVCCSASRQAALTLGHLLQRRLSPAPRVVSALHRRSPVRIRLFKSQCSWKNCPPSASSVLRRSRAPAARNPCRASATEPRVAPLPPVARLPLAPTLMPRPSFSHFGFSLWTVADEPSQHWFPLKVLRSSFSQSNHWT